MAGMSSWKTGNRHEVIQVLSGPSNAFAVHDGAGRFLLVDTGRQSGAARFFNALNDLNVGPGAVAAIILTHAHYDHVDNAAEAKERFRAPVIIHKEEMGFLASGESPPVGGTLFLTRWGVRFLGDRLRTRLRYRPVQADYPVEDVYELAFLGFDASIISTPASSAG